MTAAGNSPAGVNTPNRPPTSSGTVRISSSAYPSALNSSRSLPRGPVTGMTTRLSISDLGP